ncbi:MAG: fatty-acyl-CoA synthase [Thermomicrobiales bacterium]|nr:fatty-acyl-CoA synthase [Thermomicrobiales bacterium]
MAVQFDNESLSYVHGASDIPLIGATIGDLFDRVATQLLEHEALVSRHQGLRYTYAELREACDRFSRGLLALGVTKGDRIGIWSPNHAEWVIAQFATPKIGAILVNVNPAYRVRELEYALRQSGCSVLIIAPPFKTSDYASLLREVCPEIDSCEPGQLRSERLPDLRTVIAFGDQSVPGAYTWQHVLAAGESVSAAEVEERQREQAFDDPINIQYTSGTTGFPKGATLSHHSILNNGFFIGERMRFTEQDRLCIPVPFYHCFGMVLGNLACVTHGATMVIPAPGFDPRLTLEAVAEERCTALHGVPTMFIAELGDPEFARFDLSSLRTGIMAGSPCPVEVMKQVVEKMHMGEVTICYGMTETSPVSFQSTTDDPIVKRVSTVGRVHPHVECKIVDPPSGQVVPRGEPGELLSRGYIVMLDYWGNPEATADAIDAGRWMHTGDLATMDAEGYVNIVGRAKDMIIRGGENIYPREIEEFLYGHPKVRDVQVVGIPDERYGEEVMAWVILKEGESATDDELRDYCRGRIAHYKVPRYWKFTDGFPMTITGKIQKYKMRETAVEELNLHGAAAVRTA